VPDPKVDRLTRVPLFAGISKRDLEFVASRVDEVSLKPGQTLITEGQPTEAFFILQSGHVQVTRAGKPAARLGPGDFFGEVGMLDRGPATATVVTDGPFRVLVSASLVERRRSRSDNRCEKVACGESSTARSIAPAKPPRSSTRSCQLRYH
jgi:signal-transduction protein with cAMP-binding, CBS, and nucleotidyltransferase domain